MTNRTRDYLSWLLIWMIAIVLGVFTYCLCAVIQELGPADNAYVGKTQAEIEREWGIPLYFWYGDMGGRPSADGDQRKLKTAGFENWRGELFVTLEEVDGQWRCIQSRWRPKRIV